MSLNAGQALQIVRIVPVLNEADILLENLRWYADADIETLIVDGGSVDGTLDILHRARAEGIAVETRMLEGEPPWSTVAETLLGMAREYSPDLLILTAADEFLESGDQRPLRQALEADVAAGATRMRVDVMEFCLSNADDMTEASVVDRMRHYCHHSAADAFRIFRPDPSLDISNPRSVRSAADQRSAKRPYVMRHYPLRSPEQAEAKLAAGRLRPYLTGSVSAEFARVAQRGADFILPTTALAKREGGAWMRRDRATREYLRRSTESVMALRAQQRALERELRQLRRSYGEALLENERLSNPEGAPGASAGWYDEMYRINRELYDVSAEESVYWPAWDCIVGRIGRTDSVLEVGCGSGQLAQMLVERGVGSYVGFDFSLTAINMARQRTPTARFLADDARTTRLLDDVTYGVIVCTEVLEHLDEDLDLLRRIRPGARVLATVPSFHSTSHLRHFTASEQVLDRYGGVLSELLVDAIALESGGTLYLLDGIAGQGRT